MNAESRRAGVVLGLAVGDALGGPYEFHPALERVVRLGGDADTNGAVAGALLGARFGGGGRPLRVARRAVAGLKIALSW